jgi:hypothetical protein
MRAKTIGVFGLLLGLATIVVVAEEPGGMT